MAAKGITAAAELQRIRFELGGFTREQAATICGVSVRQYRRWETGRARIPSAARDVLYFHAIGFPLDVHDWHGWRFHQGRLYSPEGEYFTPAHIRALPWLQRLCDEYERERGRQKPPIVADGKVTPLPKRR